MNELAPIGAETLPSLIDRAASALSGARSSAEVLEARDMARVAYDAAKSAGRMARAKTAHDEVIAAVYRAQADAAVIEARAKVRLADEYDAAQARGEVAALGGNQHTNEGVVDANTLGLRRDEIHDARQIRDAEAAQPGRIEAAARSLVERGEEPTKAALRRAVIGDVATQGPIAPRDPAEEKARRELARLTPEALIDEVLGLRSTLADERAKRRAAEAKAEDLKAKIAVFEADHDMGAKLGRALEEIRKVNGRMKEVQVQLARETRRANALQKARDDLQARLENQMIPLN